MLLIALCVIATNWKDPRDPSTLKYCSEVRRNELLTQIKTGIILKFVLSKRNQTKGRETILHYCIYLNFDKKTNESVVTDNLSVVAYKTEEYRKRRHKGKQRCTKTLLGVVAMFTLNSVHVFTGVYICQNIPNCTI